MKRIITLMFALVSMSVNYVSAQCAGGSGNCGPTITSSVATKIETVGSNCVTTLNINIDLQHNNGFKNFVLYFYDNAIPSGVCGTIPSSNAGLLGYIVLEKKGRIFSIMPTQYNNLVPVTDFTISATPISGGSSLSISGLKLTKPGTCITSQIALYSGGANSASNPIQCYSSSSFTAYQLFISGRVDCTSPRNYDLFIDTDYKSGTTSLPISGSYNVYIDDDNDGAVDAGEIQITTGASFSTTVLPTLNRFFSLDNFYGSTAIGDLNTSKNLVVQVVPSTPGVASLVGRLGNTCGTLPVTLKSFNAKLNNSDVLLNWETANEINNKGFEIQRRLSASNSYEKIAFVDAKAAEGLGALYTYTDATARNKGSVAYRLVQTDFDGKKSYSDIRIVNTGSGKSQMVVYPNPSKGSARVSLPVQSGKADITLEDFSGKTIQRWAGYSSNTLQMDQLRPGIYLIRVRVQETGEQLIDRLIVQ
jgi:hypothetical protein